MLTFAVDFDGTIVQEPESPDAPLVLLPDAAMALRALKRAGHTLLLYSARANRAELTDPMLDPLVRAGVRKFNREQWTLDRERHRTAFAQMVAFVGVHLPGVFAAIDDGKQGKPIADYYIDNRAISIGGNPFTAAVAWGKIAQRFGEAEPKDKGNG